MSNFKVDLTNCDIEPIHIPGQIQSHGFLIVVDTDCIIRFFSDNVPDSVGYAANDLLGKPLEYIEPFLGGLYQPGLVSALINSGTLNEDFERINPVIVDIKGAAYYLIISATAGYYLLEFEPSVSTLNLNVQSLMGRSVVEILAHKRIEKLLSHTAEQVRKIIQYDRVMVYRFAEDGHGIVEAENKNEELESWKGLHYPASDIPKQARELYKLNLTRLIGDVCSTPSKITTSADNTAPLDLTYSQLRAVSPIHIQYLKNMGVASSFSISIICKEELWGLIVCHNYTPRFIDYRSREYAKLIGQILSSALEFRQEEVNKQVQDDYAMNLSRLAKLLQGSESTKKALLAEPANLLNIVNSKGAVLVYEKRISKIGITPDDDQLHGLIDWISENINEPFYSTDSLVTVLPEAEAYKAIASGIIVCVLSKKLEEYIIWFKPEQIHSVNWAGKPEKSMEMGANGLMNISPRHSFEVWSQTVSGKSKPWTSEEIRSVIRLKEEITYAINLKADTARILNERLRLAYEELETFSYTISHDLKSPIASIKSYAQLLIRDQMVMERGQKMIERIADRADQMNLMINAVLDYSRIGRSDIKYRRINTGMLISDIVKDLEVAHLGRELNVILGEMPDLYGDPMMMLQVFSNLIGNAVKYSGYTDATTIYIDGVVNESDITYTIKDNGLGIAKNDIPKIFELFNRMKNVEHIEGSGVGLAIVKRIMDKHKGRIWAESELNNGTTFFTAFNKNEHA